MQTNQCRVHISNNLLCWALTSRTTNQLRDRYQIIRDSSDAPKPTEIIQTSAVKLLSTCFFTSSASWPTLVPPHPAPLHGAPCLLFYTSGNWDHNFICDGHFHVWISFSFTWRIIAVQSCVVFCCTTTWISHSFTYIYIYIYPSILSLPPPPMCLHFLPHLIKTNFGYPYNKGKENRGGRIRDKSQLGREGRIQFSK